MRNGWNGQRLWRVHHVPLATSGTRELEPPRAVLILLERALRSAMLFPHAKAHSREYLGATELQSRTQLNIVMKVPGLRSGYEEVGGICFFDRMLDKIRLHAAGQLPTDYVPTRANSRRATIPRC